MGCDGGTIPKRDELVRMKKKPEQVDKNYELNAKWFHCALSQAELRSPIVCCELGNLYNKEAVLEYLLDKSSVTSDVASHIRSLKDVKELKLSINPAFEHKSTVEQADSYLDFQACRFICPVVGIEMNGRYKFCFLWKCGCVFSERALKEVPSTVCNKCGKPFSDEDIVMINGSEEEVGSLRAKMEERRQKTKLEKKAKKTKISETTTSTNGESSGSSLNGESCKDSPEKPAKRAKTEHMLSTSGSASSDVKVSGAKLNGAASSKGKLSELSKHKTVAEDPKASKVYKSLFSSSHKGRPKHLLSNWVTHHSYHI
ncbi:Protein RTF2 [Desmophyllum pertusum]|uniref:Replication termination factor 2 n=1 Tax=Desmophyllum pertusum TaxID=174260 RepID=A0A9X0A692_9CNID|nr:Protein RTF2 [Desmophyllum pertusum]